MPTPHLQFLVAALAGWVNRGRQDVIDYLQAENRVLREQLGGHRLRLADAQRCRLATAAKRVGRGGLFGIGTLVTPDTLLRWYRRLVAQKYEGGGIRKVGRPKIAGRIERVVVAMARENGGWGYTRIRGARYNLGHEVSRSTIQRILRDNGIDPAPERGKTTTWETFLKSHWGAIAATDFFSVEVLTPRGLVRYLVLFVIDLKTRTVEIAGIVREPNGDWMKQIARNLTDVGEGVLRGARRRIHDRDPRIVPLGERHLRLVVSEHTKHYHLERNHQGIGNRLIVGPRGDSPTDGRVACRRRLGGMLRFYYRAAA